MVAIMALVLMGTAALAVDLGQAFVRHRAITHDTDLAAYAGAYGNDLPNTNAPIAGGCSYGAQAHSVDQAVKDVAAYFNLNNSNAGQNLPSTTAAALVDCNLYNGEAMFGTVTGNGATTSLTYNANYLTVISPQSQVDFTLGQALGKTKTQVLSRSTVGIFSPLLNTLPLYAFTGCDFGHQTIAQPNNGHADGQYFSHDGETNVASVDSLTTNPATTPPSVPLDPLTTNDSLVISGKKLNNVTDIGFFEAGYSGTGPEPVIVPTGKFTINSATSITIPHMPSDSNGVSGTATVVNVADYWYLRVKIGGQWSKMYPTSSTLTPSVVVGNPTLTCAQGSSSGNFGTLQLPNSQGPNGQAANIAYNIAAGLEHPVGIFPNAASNWLCTAASVGAKVWPAAGTNCADTMTGLDLNAANDGFLNGVSGKPGKLTNVAAGTGCASSGNPATKVFGTSGKTINNDTLSCFFTDDTTNIGDIDNATYSLPGPVLSSAIYTSPRFVIVPVLGVQPSTGGSNKYQMVGFRTAFIADQPNSATRLSAVTADNGITGTSSIDSLQVVFFNDKALPPYQGQSVQDFTGSGPKVIRMMN